MAVCWSRGSEYQPGLMTGWSSTEDEEMLTLPREKVARMEKTVPPIKDGEFPICLTVNGKKLAVRVGNELNLGPVSGKGAGQIGDSRLAQARGKGLV